MMSIDHQHQVHQHHDHNNDHHHQHQNQAESYPHVQGGPTVLDIGGTIGALIATMNPDAAGTELHLRSEHSPPIAIHTGVWQRGSGEDRLTTAVFAELPEGRYAVLDDDGVAQLKVQITGGAVTQIDLRN